MPFPFPKAGLHALVSLIFSALLFTALPARAQSGPLVLAASSLQESLREAAARWAAKGHPRPVLSFAASSALARQIGAGAPADLFISADEAWMDDVSAQGLIRPATRVSFLANRLVLVAPASARVRLTPAPRFPLVRALGRGRLAIADPDAVPAGKYARAALIRYGLWSSVAPRLARAENVRAALALVERGEASLGIVYATDARAAKVVRVVGVFPSASHPAITYPVATLKAATHPDTEGFRRFLLSAEGKAAFRRHGFVTR